MRDASYLSLFRAPHRHALEAADALVDLAGRDDFARVVFSTSGGAAIDAVMKLSRQYWAQRGEPARNVVVGLRGSYHGTMYGSQSLSGDELLQQLYAVDRRAIRHVAHDDDGAELDLLLQREGGRIAAVVVEPVLGTGAHVLSQVFVDRLLELRERHGFLLVADEVATGFWRTGPRFASGEWDAAPDALVLSKALTNGSMGAAVVLVGPRIASDFVAGGWTFVHGETQAGSPAVAVAVLAVLAEFDRIDAAATTRRLAKKLQSLADGLVSAGLVDGVTGRGCFLGLALRHAGGEPLSADEVRGLVAAIAEEGVVVQPGPSGIGLIPAYGYRDAELVQLDLALRTALGELREARA